MVLGLKAIVALNQNFTIKPIVEFLCGVKTKDVLDYELDQHELFGQGEEKGNLFWYSLLRQAILLGFVTKDIETYGILKMNAKGLDFIKNLYQ